MSLWTFCISNVILFSAWTFSSSTKISLPPSSAYPYILSFSRNVVHNLKPKPTLLFLHGSYHNPSCFESLMRPLSKLGHECIAVPLRGTFEGLPPAPYNKKNKVTIDEHKKDLVSFLDYRRSRNKNERFVLISHSFSSLLLLKSLQHLKVRGDLKDIVTTFIALCPVPPTGNGNMTLRFLLRKPVLSIYITLGLAAKLVMSSPKIARCVRDYSFLTKDIFLCHRSRP